MATRVVKRGDTLSSIASEFGVNVSDISGFRSGNPDLIFPGEILTIGGLDISRIDGTDGTDGTERTSFDFSGFGTSAEDQALNKLVEKKRRESTRDIDERKIRRDTLALFQGQIDAVNQIYDNLISEEKIAGAGRAGQGRAIRNRGGLVGSQRGETQRQNIVSKNQAATNLLSAERSAKIGNILGTVRSSTLSQIREERAAKQQSASDYLKFLDVQDERRDKNVNTAIGSLIAQGFTLDDLNEEEFEELTSNLKVSEDDLRVKFDELTAVDEPEQFTLSAGGKRFDAEGNLIAENPKTFAPKTFAPKEGDGDNDVVPGRFEGEDDIMTFDEFKESDEGIRLLEEEENRLRQSLAPFARDEFLRGIYEEQVESLREEIRNRPEPEGFTQPSLENLGLADRRDLEGAGLLEAEGLSQTYFINTPTKFRDFFSREVSLGNIPRSASLDEINEAYEKWFAENNKDSSEEDELDPLDDI